MSLQPGSFVGPFEIVGPLGAGGMGEVYRARDAKLNREVAIKVLPAALANDGDYLARFQREAQALAALQHPHIATIYGLEGNAIVMELVEGAPLRGPLPVAEVIPIARQIAEALEAAHEKGIIHRDLKPGNILVSPSGVVKILDFGLAKAVEAPSNVSGANSPTLTMRATEAGLILGTAGYMAPEQAAGKPVDRRSDIWSFGVVLWELIAGKRLFDGETVSHTLAEVLKEPIELSVIPAGPMRELIGRCLDRNVKSRLQHIGEARIALENYREATPAVRQARPANWLVTAGVAVLAAAGAGFVCWRVMRPEPPPFRRLSVNLGRDALTQSITRNTTFDLSADGRKVAYIARGPAGVPQLAIRYFDREQPVLLPGTEDAIAPFFSPDGEWVVYTAAGKLKKVMSGGGLPIPLADAPNLRGGTFDADGNIIAAPNIRGGLMLIPAAGGAPRPYTNLTGVEVTHRWPHALPGGTGVVFISSATPGNYENAVIEFASPKGERKVLHRGGYMPRYLASGHLTFMSQGTLFAAPLDLQKMELTGPPVAVLHDVDAESGGGLAPLAASANGMFLYRSGMGQRISDLVWVDAAGKRERLPLKPMEIERFHLSPDGKRVAIGGRSGEVSVYNIATDVLTRLQSLGGNPLWTPDGRHLACTNIKGITLLPSDGSGTSVPLTDNPIDSPSGWGPDASILYFSRATELWRLPLDWTGGGQPKAGRPSKVEGAGATRTRISPDGRFGAGSSTVSGNYEVNVFSLADGQRSRWQVSTDGGFAPAWSPRGGELFYVRGDGRVVSLPYRADGESFQPGKAQVWAEGRGTDPRLGIEVSADGKRYLSLALPEGQKDAPQPETILLLGFFDELKRRMGGK